MARATNVDWSADLAIAPEGALARVSTNINHRGKRAFGVLKTENEFVGVVSDDEFEIWERQKRAIHALGQIRALRRGSRVEVRFILPFRTRVLLGAFAVLYVLAALGIATQPPDTSISAGDVLIAVAGAFALAAIFIAGARSQRSDLRTFFEAAFADVPRV